MSPAPGVIITSGGDLSSSLPPVEIGTWFVTGLAEKGPTDEATLVRSLGQFKATYGGHASYGELYNALDTFFHEGGGRAYVGRIVGPEAASASVTLKDGEEEETLVVTAVNAGEWGNSLSIVVTVESEKFTLTIKDDEDTVGESPLLGDNASAVTWAESSSYITITDKEGGTPAAETSKLTGGKDDRTNAKEEQWTAALGKFAGDLGPGQVSAPGHTTSAGQEAILAHCETNHRIALLDGTDTGTAGTLTSAAATLRAKDTARYGGLFAPWVKVPGLSPGTTRTVAPSAVVAGALARNDAAGLNPNEPAAGADGVSRYAVGLSQSAWSDEDRETLNNAGVNILRSMYGSVRVYGFRTLVDTTEDPTWKWLSNARLDAYIKAESLVVGERFEFREIGKKVPAEFGSAIEAEVLLPLYNVEALYGETQAEAFQVDTGEAVNPPSQLAEGKLKAVAGVRMSPAAEIVEIVIVKEAI